MDTERHLIITPDNERLLQGQSDQDGFINECLRRLLRRLPRLSKEQKAVKFSTFRRSRLAIVSLYGDFWGCRFSPDAIVTKFSVLHSFWTNRQAWRRFDIDREEFI
jgi:hypothetical protein